MIKLKNPFTGTAIGTVFITQTYHAGGGNIAPDFVVSGISSSTPVYAMSDGTVQIISNAWGTGSYLLKSVDNESFQEFYVHTARWTVSQGQHVVKGQQIGYIATVQECADAGVTITGMHLHMGLTTGYYLMDYISRDITFRTLYQDIANEWFNGLIMGNINWSLFNNYYINQSDSPTPPPVPPYTITEDPFPFVLYARKRREI
jgi:murein DD-endopeptidase MepM/ murein hydrolase activator NlpD